MLTATSPARRVAAALLLAAALAAAPARAAVDDVDAEGPITALTDTSLTVEGLTFLVTAATEIETDDGAPLSFADLELGMIADVEGGYRSDGVLIAEEIEIDADCDDFAGGDDCDGQEVEVDGRVTALTDTSLTVAGLTFGVTAATRVEDDDDDPRTFADVTLGLRVEVEGRLLAGGRLVAHTIEIDFDDDCDDLSGGDDCDDADLEVEGLITALSADALTVRGLTFALTPATIITRDDDCDDDDFDGDDCDQPLPSSALAVGLRVEVDGRYDADGLLTALRVEIDDDADDDELELRGPIEALGEASLTVAGTAFTVTPATRILDRARQPILFSALVVGQTVEVKSRFAADGTATAMRITLEDGAAVAGAEIEVRAALDATGDSLVVVLGRAFTVTPRTRILADDDTPIALADLPVGLPVEVKARREADGSLVALRIEREDGPATAIRLRALVTAVAADSVDVLGVRFGAATATVVGLGGAPATLADVAVGQAVELTGRAEADGTRSASRIEIRRLAQAGGRVAAATPGSLSLPGVTVVLSPETLILTEDGAPATVAAGDAVRVTGTAVAPGQIAATQVVVLAPAGIVATDGAPAAPALAARVFPNPTAGRATLRLDAGGATSAEVAVIDVLGREVLRLAPTLGAGTLDVALDTARLPAGRYAVRVTLDGRPAATLALTVVR